MKRYLEQKIDENDFRVMKSLAELVGAYWFKDYKQYEKYYENYQLKIEEYRQKIKEVKQ